MTLCEYILDVAEEETRKNLHAIINEKITELSDEIIRTAEECDPDESNGDTDEQSA